MAAHEESAREPGRQVLEKCRTSLGLYATAQEAYEMWKAKPEQVKIIDVRTPEEYIFVGHPAMAWNIPLVFTTYTWNIDKQEPYVRVNPDFVARVKSLVGPADTLLVMCRSGERSAMAVNALAKAGFTTVYNIIDGFEGDRVTDPESAYKGKRMKNGWKNFGLPWTYDGIPEQMWLVTP